MRERTCFREICTCVYACQQQMRFHCKGMLNSRSISLPHVQFSLPMTNSSISPLHIPDTLLVMGIIWSHILLSLSKSGKYQIACMFMWTSRKETRYVCVCVFFNKVFKDVLHKCKLTSWHCQSILTRLKVCRQLIKTCHVTSCLEPLGKIHEATLRR